MAEEIKPETKVEDPKPVIAAAPALDEDKIGAAIAKGLSAERREREEAERAAPPPPRISALPPIEDVSDEEIEIAREAGDRAKVIALTRKQRLADQARYERSVDQRMSVGVQTLSELAEQSVSNDPFFKKYEREVRQKIGEFRAANPNALAGPDIWKAALDLVVGTHRLDIQRESREEAIRQARDPAPAAAAPTGGRNIEAEPEEPTTLDEELGTGFKKVFEIKQRSVRGRTHDEEVRLMDAVFREKMPIDPDTKKRRAPADTVADYLKERREMQKIAEEDPSFGLGS